MPPIKLAILLAVGLFAGSAHAQSPGQDAAAPDQNASKRQQTPVRVQTSITFFLAGSTGEGDEAQTLRDRSRRLVYDMANRECELLRETLAKDCRLESISSNVNASNRMGGDRQPEGYSVNGSMNLQITLK